MQYSIALRFKSHKNLKPRSIEHSICSVRCFKYCANHLFMNIIPCILSISVVFAIYPVQQYPFNFPIAPNPMNPYVNNRQKQMPEVKPLPLPKPKAQTMLNRLNKLFK